MASLLHVSVSLAGSHISTSIISSQRQPDIFLTMVESVREHALRKERLANIWNFNRFSEIPCSRAYNGKSETTISGWHVIWLAVDKWLYGDGIPWSCGKNIGGSSTSSFQVPTSGLWTAGGCSNSDNDATIQGFFIKSQINIWIPIVIKRECFEFRPIL